MMESALYHELCTRFTVFHTDIINCYEAPFSRLVLLCLVILSKRCIFVIENPVSSLIFKHYRFEWLCNKVAYVSSLNYSQAFQDLYRVVRIEKLIHIGWIAVLRSTGCHSGWDCLGAKLQKEHLSGPMTCSFGDWILEYFAGVPKRNQHHAS